MKTTESTPENSFKVYLALVSFLKSYGKQNKTSLLDVEVALTIFLRDIEKAKQKRLKTRKV